MNEEIQSPTPTPQQETVTDPSSFKLYAGKAPLALQIIGGLMWLGGLAMILMGIPLLLAFGFGLIPIVLGVLIIKTARAVFKMQKKGFKWTLILFSFTLIMQIAEIFYRGKFITEDLIALAYVAVVILAVLSYKNKFVNV